MWRTSRPAVCSATTWNNGLPIWPTAEIRVSRWTLDRRRRSEVCSATDRSNGSWEEQLSGRDPTVELFRGMSREWYRRGPFEPRIVDLYRRYFEALAETGGPVLVHCAAGKDRTGLIVAFTHHLAGVNRADILDDYLLTNELVGHEARLRGVGERIAAICGRVPTDEAVRAALGVDVGDLDAAIAVIEDRYGSIDAYLEQVLGVDSARRSALEAHLLG